MTDNELPVIWGDQIKTRESVFHSCEVMESLPDESFGVPEVHNKLVYARGKRLTDGFDVNVVINTHGYNDIVVEQWYMKDRMLSRNKVKLRMNFCPFCGEKLWKDGDEIPPDRAVAYYGTEGCTW